MFNKKSAKRFCSEDISLIENYDKASKDLLEVWDIHHLKEDEGYSKQDLINLGLYYGRPASELKFLTHKEHAYLHKKGEKNPNYGKHLSEEHRKKLSEANKGRYAGEKHPFYGKHHSEEAKKKISETLSKQINQIDKKTGHVIKTWPCTREVERVLGINHGNISSCCSGKIKSAGGYIWQYA